MVLLTRLGFEVGGVGRRGDRLPRGWLACVWRGRRRQIHRRVGVGRSGGELRGRRHRRWVRWLRGVVGWRSGCGSKGVMSDSVECGGVIPLAAAVIHAFSVVRPRVPGASVTRRLGTRRAVVSLALLGGLLGWPRRPRSIGLVLPPGGAVPPLVGASRVPGGGACPSGALGHNGLVWPRVLASGADRRVAAAAVAGVGGSFVLVGCKPVRSDAVAVPRLAVFAIDPGGSHGGVR